MNKPELCKNGYRNYSFHELLNELKIDFEHLKDIAQNNDWGGTLVFHFDSIETALKRLEEGKYKGPLDNYMEE